MNDFFFTQVLRGMEIATLANPNFNNLNSSYNTMIKSKLVAFISITCRRPFFFIRVPLEITENNRQ